MGDIALRWDLELGAADLALESDEVATDEGLRTAVLLSLFTDRRAEDEDVLPSDDGDRRGWWADELAEDDGDRIGSRLWLLGRAKIGPGFTSRVQELVREGLAWMLADRVASAIDVQALVDGHVLRLVITISRPQADPVSFRFAHTWNAEVDLAV